MAEPHWKGRGVAAAAAVRKTAAVVPLAPPRDYITPAAAAANAATVSGVATQKTELVSAIIIAQALDRLGDRLGALIIEAAAISQYKRGP